MKKYLKAISACLTMSILLIIAVSFVKSELEPKDYGLSFDSKFWHIYGTLERSRGGTINICGWKRNLITEKLYFDIKVPDEKGSISINEWLPIAKESIQSSKERVSFNILAIIFAGVVCTLSFLAFWWMFIKKNPDKPPAAKPEDDTRDPVKCLECGHIIPGGYVKCSECGWTYKTKTTKEDARSKLVSPTPVSDVFEDQRGF